MKTKLFLLATSAILLTITSCQMDNKSKDNDKEKDISIVTTDSSTVGKESVKALPYTTLYNVETDRFEIIKNMEYKGSAKVEDLASALNAKYQDIKIEVLKKSNDTLLVHIPHASRLTQNTGTTGAMSYLVEATYAFTSIEGIHVVDFSFKEGDHAVPGSYTRESFGDFFK